jgi:hypothetical protein
MENKQDGVIFFRFKSEKNYESINFKGEVI